MVSSFCLDPTVHVAIRSNKITNTMHEGDVVWITRLICNPEQSFSRLVEDSHQKIAVKDRSRAAVGGANVRLECIR